MMSNFLSPDDFILLKWIIVLVAWALLGVALYFDYARIKVLRENSITTDLFQLLSRRNLQIFGLVSMALLVIIAGDVRHHMEEVAATASSEPQIMEKPPNPAAVAASVAAISQPSDLSTYNIPHDSRMPFSDITEFNEQNSKQQAWLDLLKQRYETWLITYFYLVKCNKVSNQDYAIIIMSLRKELQSANADSTLEGNIMTAAKGSYTEMYSEIPCDEAHVASTKAGYDETMRRMNAAAQAAPKQPQTTPAATTPSPVGRQF